METVGSTVRACQAGSGGNSLALFSRFKEMQLFIDEKELSVTKGEITTLRNLLAISEEG